jgi:SAM-dependent methyltransferase
MTARRKPSNPALIATIQIWWLSRAKACELSWIASGIEFRAMTEKLLVPIYLPRWLLDSVVKAKRALVPSAAPETQITIWGERSVEWAFLSKEMPSGPGEAIEFGCEEGYMSLVAAQKGFHVIANDLQEQTFIWEHPNVEFRKGDFLKLNFPREQFDLAINCSSVEHVGVAGRYGIEINQDDGDIQVMKRLAEILKPGGLLLMTAPCGNDAVLAPWCRVYGSQRLPTLLQSFRIEKEEYWTKNDKNQWVRSEREAALAFQPRNDRVDPHQCAYALGCFVLRKSANPDEPGTISLG